MERVLSMIKSGKQRGKRFSYEKNNKTYWSSVGMQKHDGFYKVYIDEIEESQMVAENYEKDDLVKFSEIEEARNYLEKETILKLADLKPCKGLKIFNPNFCA